MALDIVRPQRKNGSEPYAIPRLSTKDIERFWRLVHKTDGCWEWAASKNRVGYGRFRYRDGWILASHRVSWTIFLGKIPRGLRVCHHCDNPGCVRPSHLFLGTIADNNRDALQKGRVPVGESSSGSRLTERQVRQIMSMKGKVSNVKLGKRFGVSNVTIGNIHKGRTWKHLGLVKGKTK